ncbi:MAG: GRAS family protein [Thiolinea sp.]
MNTNTQAAYATAKPRFPTMGERRAVSEPRLLKSISRLLARPKISNVAEFQRKFKALNAYCTQGMEDDSGKFLAALCLNALNTRLSALPKVENIYEKHYDVSQIRLFDILINKFPFVKYSQQMVNAAIINSMRGHGEITLVDIGIGLGTQMMNVLEQAKALPELKKLTLIGIEPFSAPLQQAEAKFAALASSLPFSFEFIPVAEYVEKTDFAALCRNRQGVIVNASLALHHIQSSADRDRVMRSIKDSNPLSFLLIEPNSDHFEPNLQQRLRNCYQHFYSLFRVIDTLDIAENEKNALKLFFGREIEDILGKQEQDRFEKHEPASRFIARLHQAGFICDPARLDISGVEIAGVSVRYHDEGFVGFNHDNETILGVICARLCPHWRIPGLQPAGFGRGLLTQAGNRRQILA